MTQKSKKPPQLAQRLLFHILNKYDADNIIGDFDEFFYEISAESGFLRTIIWYWLQLLKSIPKFLFNSIYWSFEMFKNYMKISFRNIRKSKVYSFINISGLSIYRDGLQYCPSNIYSFGINLGQFPQKVRSHLSNGGS